VSYKPLFKAADEALYRAKAAGHNCVLSAEAPEPAPLAEPALVPTG